MNNMLGLGIILSLQDKASSGLEAVRKRMTALRDVSQEMMKRFDEGAKQMIAGFALMTTGAKTLGLLSKTFGMSVNTAADFEQAMARVGAVSGAVGADFEKLTKQARDLGRDTQYSATQVASSQELLARAGFQTNEIITAMPDLLYMAGAEGMDMARATDIAAGTLRGFGLEATEMSRVANVLAQTSRMTNTSIDTLGESFKYVAPDARMLKVSIEEVAAIVRVMGDANIKASQAGTYLRGAFNKLVSPTKETSEALKSLGISITDRQGELKSFDVLMQELSDKMKGMTGFQKKNLFGQLFDARSATGMLAVLGGFESGKLKSSLDTLRNIGSVAKEMYDRMSATAQGAMKRLESATEGLRISLGNHLLPIYTKAIDLMAQFKSWLTKLIEDHPIISKAVIGLTTTLISLAGTALILFGALVSVAGMVNMWPLMRKMAILSLTSIRSRVRDTITAFSGFGGSFAKVRVPIVGLIALAGALYYAWRKNLWGIRDMVEAVTQGFKMAWNASTDGIAEIDEALAQKLEAAGIFDYAVMMGRVFFRVRQFWNGLVEGFKEGVNFLMGVFDWMKDIFSPVIESGQELLKFLGILKPVAESHADTWKAWGQLLGRLAPAIIAVVTAFKGVRIIKSIFGDVGKAIVGMFNIITAHPIGALIVALVALGIYLYTHWEEVSAFFAKIWNKIAGYGKAAVDWIKLKWQELSDWWNSWTLKDIFAPVLQWASDIKANVLQKWEELNAWWNSWSLGDIFAPIYDFAIDMIERVKQPFIDFKNWLLGIFANMNPFNWELPSWLGGGTTGSNQVNNANAALSGYQPPSIPARATGGIITKPEIALIGEAGREAIIPLEKQARGTALWIEAGRELGLISGRNTIAERNTEITRNVKETNTALKESRNNVIQVIPSTANAPEVLQNYNVMPNSVKQSEISVIPHETGGIFSQPHIGLVAEVGRELGVINNAQSSHDIMSDVVNALKIQTWNETQNLGDINSHISERILGNGAIKISSSNLQKVSSIIPHATGGIFSQPHIGLVAEAGREAIIPLERQSRGTELWIKAGRELGLIPENNPIVNDVNVINAVSSGMGNVIPEIVNALKFQPNVNIKNRREPSVKNSREVVQSYNTNMIRQFSENSAITQVRDMVMRMAESSVIREISNRAIPQVVASPITRILTNNITGNSIIDRTSRTSSLQKVITNLIEHSSKETHSRFANENVVQSYNVMPRNMILSSSEQKIFNQMKEAERNINYSKSQYAGSTNTNMIRQFSENSAITHARDMIVQMAGNSVMREVLNRVIPQTVASSITQILTNNRADNSIIDRTSQTLSLQKIMTERSSNETHSNFADENSVLHEITNSIMPIIPHAMGGIFSVPHIGLIAEAGREAVIPLEDKSHGIPLLMAAANAMMGENIITDQPYSLPILVQQSQNQTVESEQEETPTTAQHTGKQPVSNNEVIVNVDVKPADVYIDGEKIGRISFRWSERQSIRSGMGS